MATNRTKSDIGPLFNDAFIRIFGEDGSRTLVRSLVNALLEKVGIEPITTIESISAEHTEVTGSIDCKTPRMDVRIICPGRVFDLEAQGYTDDVANKSLFYGAKSIGEETERGTEYNKLPQVTVITLLDDAALHPKSDDFIFSARMEWRQEDGESVGKATDRLMFVLVELAKIRKRYTELNDEVLHDKAVTWAYLLTKGFADNGEVDSIMAEFPDIKEFAERYGLAVNDPKVRQAYEDAISAELEYNSRQRYYARLKREAIEEGYEQGMEQGMEQGAEKERARMIAAMREQGVSESIISACLP